VNGHEKISDLPEMIFPIAANGCPIRNLPTGRQEAPLVRLDSPGLDTPLVIVGNTSTINRIFDDSSTFTSRHGPQARRFSSEYSAEVSCVYRSKGLKLLPVLAWSDAEDHIRYRRLVDRAFLPTKMERKKAYIAAFVEELLGRVPESGEMEFMDDFAKWLPAMVILRELGLGMEHAELLMDTANKAAQMLDFTSTDEQVVRGAHAVTELESVLVGRIEAVRRESDETLLSDMVHATSPGQTPLNNDELLSLCVELLVAGAHSTAGMLGWSLYTLALRPDIHRRLQTEPGKVAAFVEEVLRRHSVIVNSYRTAENDTELDGVAIPKGTHVAVRLDCANMDRSRWQNPETIDIDRPQIARHHAFGRGRHTCIGNGLARTELTLTVGAIVRRSRTIELLIGPNSIDLFPSFDGHMIAALPLRLHAN